MQNLKENWLLLSKWHEEFEKFSPEHLKASKLELWWDSFGQSWKCISLIFTEEWRMKNVSWEQRMVQKLKTNWRLNSKLTWTIWQILIQALKNLKNLHFNGLPLTEVYNVWPKKVQGSYVWCQWILMQKLKENWLLLFKNDIRNLGNFCQSTWKSQNLDFGILLNRK